MDIPIGYLVVDNEQGEPRQVLTGILLEDALDFVAQNYAEISTNWSNEEGVFWGHDLVRTHTRISFRPFAALREILPNGKIGKWHSLEATDFVLPYLVGDRPHTSTSYNTN